MRPTVMLAGRAEVADNVIPGSHQVTVLAGGDTDVYRRFRLPRSPAGSIAASSSACQLASRSMR